MRRDRAGMSTVAAVLATVVVIVTGAGIYIAFGSSAGFNNHTSTTTSADGIQGVVTGYVTVGPSQPVCHANQTCNVNMTGYSLVFTPQCSGSSSMCQSSKAQLSPSGHYSILLPPGTYSVTGLSPDCKWMGCTSAFPKTVVVQGGTQVVFDLNVDTGIR
jgi:hypothetical protein